MTAISGTLRPKSRGSALSILVVDDHALFREGLRHLLDRLDTSVHVCEAADARAALAILRSRDDLDIVLLDWALPDAKPFEVLRETRRLQPQVPVVVLSSRQERFEVERAMNLGAQAVVFKSSSSEKLLRALRRVMRGEIVVPTLLGSPQPLWLEGGRRGGASLTGRQIDVLRMLARGLCNKEIGEALGVAANTVKVHLARIYRTLGVTSRTAALLKAFESGVIERYPGRGQ